MLIKKPALIAPSEITPDAVFRKRRSILAAAAGIGLAPWLAEPAGAEANPTGRLAATPNPTYTAADKPTSLKDIASYNNFYEFGVDKSEPASEAQSLKTRPWSISVEGLVKTPKVWSIDDLMKLAALEDRVYRHRCVEGWSMVIPWVGYPLAELMRRAEPLAGAKYVEFVTLADKSEMPGLNYPVLQWPYREGLRIDEAGHPLTLLTFGVYGEVLPNQNGAPVRIVVPWKYGFKSAKSIVTIRFTDRMPLTSWNQAAPSEYGFYSNVNPNVDHPRWSQATERRIGDAGGLFAPRRKTLLFNGYESDVGQMYAGMDLRKFF